MRLPAPAPGPRARPPRRRSMPVASPKRASRHATAARCARALRSRWGLVGRGFRRRGCDRGGFAARARIAPRDVRLASSWTALVARDANLLQPARIGIEYLDLEVARARHDLAARGEPSDPRHHVAGERIDLVGDVRD